MSTNSYNPQRQLLFVRRQLTLSQQTWLIAAGAIFGLLLIVTVLAAVFNTQELYQIQGFYLATFFFGGLIFTSMAFKELHSPHRSYFFLTLPASTLEKLVGAWLITSPLYIVGFTLLSFVVFLLGFLITGVPFSLSYFFNSGLVEVIISYLVIQTIFLWGACYFRKNNFLKTVLSLIVIGIVFAMYLGLLVWLFFETNGHAQVNEKDVAPWLTETISNSAQVFFFGILGPYMLLMSYFTLKERQV